MDGVFGFTKVLILANGSGEIEGEVGVNNMVDAIGKRFLGVKEAEMVWSGGGADIVHQSGSQWTSMNRVA